MAQLIFLVTAAFASLGFIANQPQKLILNPLYNYYYYEAVLILHHIGLFLFFFLLIIFILFRSKSPQAILQAIQVLVLGFLLSSLFLFAIAFFELNALSIIFNLNPKFLGVVTDQSAITEALKTYPQPPQIINNDALQNSPIYAIAYSSAGKDNYYGNSILVSLPKFLILASKTTNASLLLVNNTLIIEKVNPLDIQNISPFMGYLFVKQLFPGRNIKAYPNVSLMSQEEYQKYRESDFSKKLLGIDDSLAKVTDNIASLSAGIMKTQNDIASTEGLLKDKYSLADSQYLHCLNINQSSVCEKNKLSAYGNITSIQEGLDTLNKTSAVEKKQLQDYQLFALFYQEQKGVGKLLINNIPQERGAYDEKDNIKLNLDNIDPHAIADYFETLIHEYLHYASFISDQKKFSSAFFEEGLTEYYARLAVRNNLDISPNIGYPAIAKIISKIAKNIPDPELIDIYFSKDDVRLEAVLNRIYGDDFYKNNRIFFDALQYTSDPRQILQLANIIMSKIGGQPLTENDIYSTSDSSN